MLHSMMNDWVAQASGIDATNSYPYVILTRELEYNIRKHKKNKILPISTFIYHVPSGADELGIRRKCSDRFPVTAAAKVRHCQVHNFHP